MLFCRGHKEVVAWLRTFALFLVLGGKSLELIPDSKLINPIVGDSRSLGRPDHRNIVDTEAACLEHNLMVDRLFFLAI